LGRTLGWVNNDRMFIFGWTVHLIFPLNCLFTHANAAPNLNAFFKHKRLIFIVLLKSMCIGIDKLKRKGKIIINESCSTSYWSCSLYSKTSYVLRETEIESLFLKITYFWHVHECSWEKSNLWMNHISVLLNESVDPVFKYSLNDSFSNWTATVQKFGVSVRYIFNTPLFSMDAFNWTKVAVKIFTKDFCLSKMLFFWILYSSQYPGTKSIIIRFLKGELSGKTGFTTHDIHNTKLFPLCLFGFINLACPDQWHSEICQS